MELQIRKQEIFKLLCTQLANLFTLRKEEEDELSEQFDNALELCQNNFSYSDNKYYCRIEDGGGKKHFLARSILFNG